jgi:hypothetical protein
MILDDTVAGAERAEILLTHPALMPAGADASLAYVADC